MKSIFRYMKPYVPALIITVIMLFGQINLELALPEMLSRIVTNGLQQKGVEHTLPLALEQELMDRILTGLNSDEGKSFQSLYHWAPQQNSYEELADKRFTLLQEEGLYILDQNPGNKPLPYQAKLQTILQEEWGAPVIAGLAAYYDYLGYSQAKRQTYVVLKQGGRMLIYTLASVILIVLVGLLGARTSAGVAQSLRSELFDKVQSFSQHEMDSFSTASLITRSTNDIRQIQQMVFMMMRLVILAPLMGIGGFIRAADTAPEMSWILAVAVLFLLVFSALGIGLTLPRFRNIQTLVDRLNKMARENLTGLAVVRAFTKELFEEKRFDRANLELTENNLYVMRVMAMMMPLIGLVMNLLSVLIVWVGAQRIAESGMNVGDMIAFLQYSMRIVISFMLMTMVISFLPRAAVSADRIAEVLDRDPSIKDPITPRTRPKEGRNVLAFNEVDFAYPGSEEKALKQISFTLEPGKTTAVIGSTGSGKSTLVYLIPRLYDVTEGSITLDGIDIREMKQEELRRSIAMVPQKNVLFSGNLADNLAYGREDADEKILLEALHTAQGDNILQNREGTALLSKVSQGGNNFSGGQKQRLSIARALASERPILIFDDSFSALDFKTDRALRQELREKCRDKALLIVAQRVSTIMQADQILVLDEGRIVGMGNHQTLLESCPTYYEIAKSQLNLEAEA